MAQTDRPTEGTIDHVLLSGGCPALADARLSMISLFQAYLVSRPYLFHIFQSVWGKDDMKTTQFLLDCSAIPLVRQQAQESKNSNFKDLFYQILCVQVMRAPWPLLSTHEPL